MINWSRVNPLSWRGRHASWVKALWEREARMRAASGRFRRTLPKVRVFYPNKFRITINFTLKLSSRQYLMIQLIQIKYLIDPKLRLESCHFCRWRQWRISTIKSNQVWLPTPDLMTSSQEARQSEIRLLGGELEAEGDKLWLGLLDLQELAPPRQLRERHRANAGQDRTCQLLLRRPWRAARVAGLHQWYIHNRFQSICPLKCEENNQKEES